MHAKLYPQNGDRIVVIDSVTSFHPIYIQFGDRESPICTIFAPRKIFRIRRVVSHFRSEMAIIFFWGGENRSPEVNPITSTTFTESTKCKTMVRP